MQMALIILHQVVLTVVFCSMTSHATEVSGTYREQVNSTGGKVCAADKPSTVIPMAVRAMRIQCGGKCNEAPSCRLFQLNEDLKQCELFDYSPSNFAPLDHCTAYMSSKEIVIQPSTLKPSSSATTQVVPMMLAMKLNYPNIVLATALLDDQLFFTVLTFARVYVINTTTFATVRTITFSTLGTALYSLVTSAVDNCLYISDYSNQLVHRVNLSVTSTVSVVTWTVTGRPLRLSVTSENNVLGAITSSGKVTEYTPGGSIVKTVTVAQSPCHVVEVDSNTWAFSDNRWPGQVCTVLKNGTVIKCLGSVDGMNMGNPCGIAVDARGFLLVADENNSRVLLVDPTMTSGHQIPFPIKINFPRSVTYDQSNGRLYFGDYDGSLHYRLLVFDGV